MKLAHATWTQVEKYLQKNQRIIIPIGSTEQHGPTGLIGTDSLTAQSIADAVGEKTSTYVAPPICYGMARHHMGFPGSATLSPRTLMSVVTDVVDSFKAHGFSEFVFINGHGGNIVIINSAFCELKTGDERSKLKLVNWWHLPEVRAYEEENFGDQNGFHATIGEVSVTMHTDSIAFETIEAQNFEIERPGFSMPMSPTEFRETFPDGRMESNPGLATPQHGQKIFEIAVDAIASQLSD